MFAEFSHFNAQLFGLLTHAQRLQRRKRRREEEPPSHPSASSDAAAPSKKTTARPPLPSPLAPSATSPSASSPSSDSDADGEGETDPAPGALHGADEEDDEDDGEEAEMQAAAGGGPLFSASSHLAFLRFLSRHRRELAQLFPSATDEEVDERVQERWQRLPDKERREYEMPGSGATARQALVRPSEDSRGEKGDGGEKAESREMLPASTSSVTAPVQ